MQNLEYAPVFISVYNRFEHFTKCLTSLSKCKGAENTIVYISSDGAYRQEDVSNVERIREFILNFKGFKEIRPIFADENTNREIIHQTYNKILKTHDRLIRSEDDNIFSEDFLEFINRGLEAYKDRKDILAICGYNYPIGLPKLYDEDLYLWKGFSAWGYGTWNEKISPIYLKDKEKRLKEVREFLKKPSEVLKFSNIADHYLPALITMNCQNKARGDGYICMYQYLNDMYSVFPVETKVKNIGYDGSGLNCKVREDDVLTRQKLNEKGLKITFPLNLKPDEEINKKLKDYFKKSIFKKTFFVCLLLVNKFWTVVSN